MEISSGPKTQTSHDIDIPDLSKKSISIEGDTTLDEKAEKPKLSNYICSFHEVE